MTGLYATKTRGLVERYIEQIRPEYAVGVRSAFSAGEWGLAAAELASALVAENIAVDAGDRELFQELLGGIDLSRYCSFNKSTP